MKVFELGSEQLKTIAKFMGLDMLEKGETGGKKNRYSNIRDSKIRYSNESLFQGYEFKKEKERTQVKLQKKLSSTWWLNGLKGKGN